MSMLIIMFIKITELQDFVTTCFEVFLLYQNSKLIVSIEDYYFTF